ncbi:inositol 2-dehydrogenase [Cohaesibacter celericrescens]|uniref:Inositol 2-dehydrogenase n=1 Tax=Cohaesibacter celericrescens TaxID=2067669 RepID=A0A2N5XNK7_9HYPH|nr:inositol 2-dehydrogenase [Cohaesibacter celericrescens]PLW75997.1 inositol 2-dehydrogenase [Cohaesibacter celericrescens]
MLSVGLLGAGRIGQVHAANIAHHKDSQLVAVSDVFAEPASKLAKEYAIEVRSTEAILSDPAIDAVLIATSTDTHSDLIEAAVAAGKSVLCEKPVDLSLERAKRCQDVVAKSKQPVMIGFNRRFDPNFATLKAAFHAGDIGKGELLTVTSFDPAPPPVSYVKVSGGLYRDMMIHDFDIVCWLFGAVPQRVSAAGASLVDPEIGAAGDVDTAIVTLQFADGRLAVIKNSRRAAFGYDQRIELLGSTGMLSAENMLENTVVKATSAGVTSAKPEHFFLERYNKAYQIEWNAFVEAVAAKTAFPASLADGVNALALAEAANASLKQGKTIELAHFL